MTPEEILKGLHDIHVPPVTQSEIASFSVWPLLVVLAVAALTLWLQFRRRTVWQRQAKLRLAQIASINTVTDAQQGWTELATLLRQIALRAADAQRPENEADTASIKRLTGQAWLEQLDNLSESSLFTTGSGPGLLSFPYQPGTGRSSRELTTLLTALTADTSWLHRICTWRARTN